MDFPSFFRQLSFDQINGLSINGFEIINVRKIVYLQLLENLISMKRYFFLLYAILINIFCIAQTPNLNWVHSYGGVYNDYPTSSIMDNNENVYWAGYFDSDTLLIGTNFLSGLPHPKLLLAKHDAAGNILWAKTQDSPGLIISNKIDLDVMGNIIMTGNFGSPYLVLGSDTFYTSTNLGSQTNFFLSKFDNSGNAIWTKVADTIGRHSGFEVLSDNIGNIYVAGVFYDSIINLENIQLINTNHIGSNNSDVFIAKYDTQGNIIWAKSFGGKRKDVIHDMCFDPDGNICFVGNSASDTVHFDNFEVYNSNQSAQYWESYLGKIDTAGNVIWANSIAGQLNDWGNGICTDMLGNFYVSGQFYSDTLDFGNFYISNASSPNNADHYIAKFSNSGIPIWAVATGGLKKENYNDLKIDNAGYLYISFETTSDSLMVSNQTFYNTGQSNISDIFLCKMDTSGNFLWVKNLFDGNPYCTINIGLNSQDIYVTGNFWSDQMLCDSVVVNNIDPNGSTCDIFIAKYSFTITEIQKPNQEHAGQLFPNPAEHLISLSGEIKPDRVFIITTTGQQTEVPLLENNTIDLSSFSNGFYLLKTQDKAGEKVYRFIKQTSGN